jgi:hypothetical protein
VSRTGVLELLRGDGEWAADDVRPDTRAAHRAAGAVTARLPKAGSALDRRETGVRNAGNV